MFRSLLFIPGNNERFLVKSASLKPDILCFDLEDSVPLNDKQVARNLLEKHLASRQESNESSVYVRINSIDSGLVDKDLDKTIVKGLEGIVLPKISNCQEVIEIADKIEKLV